MLETTIDAQQCGDIVAFAIRITNPDDEDVELSFSDSQRVRVVVYSTTEDEPRWRSDEDQLFMQMLGSQVIRAGDETIFEETWGEPEPGEYRAVGEVVCSGRELRTETEFSV
ncbi:hypothetical protein Halar_2517 [halophilic archaeon DL31]|jgi:hypothetical protein|nr:hypothetical protein Halar_2517 [halophilic archaeon DL31]